MAQDTFFKSQALSQPIRMQGERIAFAGAQSLGSSIGQAAQNYVQTSQSEQLLAQRGAEGRVRMMTEQLRQDEIRQKMDMVERGGLLRMQQLQTEAMQMQNEQMRNQLRREEKSGMSEEMQRRSIGQVMFMDNGKLGGMSYPSGTMQEMSPSQAEYYRMAGGRGQRARAPQDPAQSMRQVQSMLAHYAGIKSQYEEDPENSPYSEDDLRRMGIAIQQTLAAENYPLSATSILSAMQDATQKLAQDDEVVDEKAGALLQNVMRNQASRNQLRGLMDEYPRQEVLAAATSWFQEAMRELDDNGKPFTREYVERAVKNPRWIDIIRNRLGGE